MSRLLLDANVPTGLRSVLVQHEVVTAFEMGWGTLVNGELLSAAEAAGFDELITGDQNMAYQQNLSGRRLAGRRLANNLTNSRAATAPRPSAPP